MAKKQQQPTVRFRINGNGAFVFNPYNREWFPADQTIMTNIASTLYSMVDKSLPF